MKPSERDLILCLMTDSRQDFKPIEAAIIEDKPWEVRFRLDILIARLQTIRLHIDTREI